MIKDHLLQLARMKVAKLAMLRHIATLSRRCGRKLRLRTFIISHNKSNLSIRDHTSQSAQSSGFVSVCVQQSKECSSLEKKIEFKEFQ